jgi:hypothetical protein
MNENLKLLLDNGYEFADDPVFWFESKDKKGKKIFSDKFDIQSELILDIYRKFGKRPIGKPKQEIGENVEYRLPNNIKVEYHINEATDQERTEYWIEYWVKYLKWKKAL